MTQYPTTWVDYQLPTGQAFSVAVCGYSGKIRHMFLGDDFVRRNFVRSINVNGQSCGSGQHCLALDCPLNHTEHEHLCHMLDMPQDEPIDSETAKVWGTDSTVDSLVGFARKMNDALPVELKKERQPMPPSGAT